MPGGAKLFDKFTTIEAQALSARRPGTNISADQASASCSRQGSTPSSPRPPDNGATCTLSHGDLRGDNIFFCEANADYPDGWLCIDFQLLFRGPVPSDLAYLMSTGSVLPEVYTGDNRRGATRVLRPVHGENPVYKDYTYEAFEREYAMMSRPTSSTRSVWGRHWQAGASRMKRRGWNSASRATEADLTPEERRQRMWWRSSRELPRELQSVRPVRVAEDPPGEPGRPRPVDGAPVASAMNRPKGTLPRTLPS